MKRSLKILCVLGGGLLFCILNDLRIKSIQYPIHLMPQADIASQHSEEKIEKFTPEERIFMQTFKNVKFLSNKFGEKVSTDYVFSSMLEEPDLNKKGIKAESDSGILEVPDENTKENTRYFYTATIVNNLRNTSLSGKYEVKGFSSVDYAYVNIFYNSFWGYGDSYFIIPVQKDGNEFTIEIPKAKGLYFLKYFTIFTIVKDEANNNQSVKLTFYDNGILNNKRLADMEIQ